MMLRTLVAYLSGLYWVAPHLDLPTLVGTTVIVNTCNAIMCRVVAHNKGYPKNPATLTGGVLGIWAVALLMVAPSRAPAAETDRSSGHEEPPRTGDSQPG
jgi:hypothetical protein